MKYVIIGNSAAAIGAVEAIRKTDRTGQILILSSEPYHTYSRPLISYLLLGKTTEEKMLYRDRDFYERMHCDFRPNTTVVKLDPEQKQVLLADGSAESYDRVLVATGSSPFVPPVAGLDTVEHKTTFGSLEDAKRLSGMIGSKSRVLIIGAGLIGLKCAEGIADTVKSITVVDLAPRVLSSILDDAASAKIKHYLEQHDLRFFLGESVKEFSGNTAILTGGGQIEFDCLVLAVGVRANTALVKDAGGAVGRGITVDDHMRTSLPEVYAAGDCTESMDCAEQQIKIMALLPNAYMQGACAGANMAGQEAVFDTAIPMNSIGLFGLHMMTAGSYHGETFVQDDGTGFKELFYENDRLCGYILIGDIHRAGIYTAMIRNRTPLRSVDFDLLCREPELMAFSQADRKVMLGGREK